MDRHTDRHPYIDREAALLSAKESSYTTMLGVFLSPKLCQFQFKDGVRWCRGIDSGPKQQLCKYPIIVYSRIDVRRNKIL